MSKVINSVRSFTVPFGTVTAAERIPYFRDRIKTSPLGHLWTPKDIEKGVKRIEKEGNKRYPVLPIGSLLPLISNRPDDVPGEVMEIREEGTLYHHLYIVKFYDDILSVCRAAVDVSYLDCEPDNLLVGFTLDFHGKLIDAI